MGDPRDAHTDVGALVSRAHVDKVLGAIAQARTDGGRVLAGGEAMRTEGRCAGGWFVAPTVIDGLPPDAACNQREIFGPVTTLIPFEGEADAVAIANDTPYGLAASLWTRDVARAPCRGGAWLWHRMGQLRDLRTPFGGSKQSGIGREGGIEALRFTTEPKNVCIRY